MLGSIKITDMIKQILKIPITIMDFFVMARWKMAPISMSVPIFGGLILNQNIDFTSYIFLGLLGLSAHLFGFGLNDIIDYDLDIKVIHRKNSPLVKGSMSKTTAWILTLVQIPIMYLIYILLLTPSSLGIIILTSSIVFSVFYNLWSKKGNISKFFAELSLALSIGLILLSGTLSFSTQLSIEALLFAISMTLVLLMLNSVPSGLKDLRTDSLSGARSFVISSGCKMLDDNRIHISKKIKFYSFTLQVLIFISLSIEAYLLQIYWYNYLLICVLCFFSYAHIKAILNKETIDDFNSFNPLLNGFYTYFGSTVLLIDKLYAVWYLVILMYLFIPFNNHKTNRFNLKTLQNAWKFKI